MEKKIFFSKDFINFLITNDFNIKYIDNSYNYLIFENIKLKCIKINEDEFYIYVYLILKDLHVPAPAELDYKVFNNLAEMEKYIKENLTRFLEMNDGLTNLINVYFNNFNN